jgi:hypothetical protein
LKRFLDVKLLAEKTGESLRGIMDRVTEKAKQTLSEGAGCGAGVERIS